VSYTSLQLPEETLHTIVREVYGKQVVALKALTGEVDFNYQLQVVSGETYLLKISRPEEETAALDFQAAMMRHLAQQDLPISLPAVVPTLNGDWGHGFQDAEGRNRWVRMQSWVEGREIREANPRSAPLLSRWGAACGHLARGLQGFDHTYAHRSFRWDPCQVLAARPLLDYVATAEKRSLLEYFLTLYEQAVLPLLPHLRKSVNHNDGHERNVLVDFDYVNPRVTGLVDFGDAVYTATVNEVAIAAAYAGMQQADPLQAMLDLVRGFHSVFPLEEKEFQVLFPLICARLVISVGHSARNKQEEPDNAYLQVSDRDAWALLEQFRDLSPTMAAARFRSACGLEPFPQRLVFDRWLSEACPTFHDVVQLEGKRTGFLDLSVGSRVLGTQDDIVTQGGMHKAIYRYMEDQGLDWAIGGYLEPRPLYTTDAYQVMGNNGPQWRTVHLGLDFWAAAGTAVYAPWPGRVLSIQDNAAERDYGPTIILEHQTGNGLTFYTLYGHLSRQDLSGLEPGEEVQAGQEIAHIGPAPENGNWPPHLHFQVMLDRLGQTGNFPGVAYPHEVAVWQRICPNPQVLVPGLSGMNLQGVQADQTELAARRKQVLGKGLSVSYRSPLHMVRGAGAYLYDTTGRRFLDTVNNVAHVGHEHPVVVAAGQAQMAVLNTNTRYLHKSVVDYAEQLLATFPPELCVVHFVNSGSEANELALRMVETITGSRQMLALEVGYHGNTGRAIDVSSYKFDGKAGRGAPPFTQVVPMPDVFRGRHRDASRAASDYADYIDQAIARIAETGQQTGGFIAEPIMSCGGQIVLPEGYLQQAYAKTRAAGGLCIADEVQVGFGRVGQHFWGFSAHGVIPDIVTLGKPIGNGHPMGAVVCTREVAEAFANGMEFFTTFGGNPVSASIGKAVLQVIRDEQLQDNALAVGNYLLAGLRSLQKRHPVIGDVRGQGLFLGFELVNNPIDKVVLPQVASYLSNRMRELGILTSTDGPQENVIKIKPPICFSRQQADFFLEQLDRVLAEDYVCRSTGV